MAPTAPPLVAIFLLAVLAFALAASAQQQGEALCLASIEVAGGNPVRLLSIPGVNCGSPRWSPDGARIAYDEFPVAKPGGWTDYSRSRIATIDGTGGSHRLVGRGGMPAWSPDGTQIAWHTYLPGPGVVVAQADGGGQEKVLNHGGSPVWINGGGSLLVFGRGGLGELNLRTGQERLVLLEPQGVYHGWSVSPDGKWVSYTNKLNQLVIAPLGGPLDASHKRVIQDCGVGSSWSPDSRQLVVTRAAVNTAKYGLHVVTVDSDDPPERVRGVPGSLDCYSPDWSPDGKQIVFSCGGLLEEDPPTTPTP